MTIAHRRPRAQAGCSGPVSGPVTRLMVMVARVQLDPAGLVEALRAAAAVVDDHRAALDRLDQGDDWDDGWDDEAPAAASTEGDVGDATGADGGGPGTSGRAAGSDLAATLAATATAAEGTTTFAALADAMVQGPSNSANGPAGRDMGQVLAGLAASVRNADRLDATRFALGLELAAERLTVADDGSHAGCLPAVLAVAADAALGAVDAGAALADTVIAAADEGLAELESGPRANPDLVERGVVDAAAAGFLLVLDVFASVITGEPLPAAPVEPVAPVPAGGSTGTRRYRVRCQVEPHDGCGLESANWLEATWHELGDLVAFDGTSAHWRAEVLTTVPGSAIEAIFDVGRPRELHVGVDDGGN